MPDYVNFERLKLAVLKNNPYADIPYIQRAFQFAFNVHKGQTRDEGSPYIIHPYRVALYLAEKMGVGDSAIIAAALLHDVIEDSPQVNKEVLGNEFGEMVADYVSMLSKNKVPGLTKLQVKQAYYKKLRNAPWEVLGIKIADRLDNIRLIKDNPYKEKIPRYVKETRKIYIPIAEKYFPVVADEMKEILQIFDQDGNMGFTSLY